jgi:hypothetical protein
MYHLNVYLAVWRILIRIRMFFGLPDPYPLVRGTDPALAPDLLSSSKIVRKTFILPVLGLLYDFLSLKNDVNAASKTTNKKLSKKLFLVAI